MVGINAIFSQKKSDLAQFSSIQEKMNHFSSYNTTILLQENNVIFGTTAYDSYPIRTFNEGQFIIIIEGMIYNYEHQVINERLSNIVKLINNKDELIDHIKDFIEDADGEYIVYIYNINNKTTIIFNDILGRLPLYYCHNEGITAISREMKFLCHYMDSNTINETSLMEYLLFGFALDNRTLLNGIHRLLPASIIQYKIPNNMFGVEQIIQLNFDKTNTPSPTRREIIVRLKENFMKGLEDRVNTVADNNIFISLSGGLDSRATLAGLKMLNISPKGITFKAGFSDESEFIITQQIAETFDIPLHFYNPSTKRDNYYYSRIVHLMDGTNPTGHSHTIDINEQVLSQEGEDIILFTGLYGGELLRNYNLTSGIHSDKDLVNIIMNTTDHFHYSTDSVCKMMGISNEYIRQHLLRYFSSYPETDIYSKYIHFKFEKDFKWAGACEDRSRLFFWSITPFFSNKLFHYAYSIRENQKNLLLFRDFLNEIDPKTCDVIYFNNGISLNSSLRLHLESVAERIVRYPLLRRMVSRVMASIKRIKGFVIKSDDSIIREIRNLSIAQVEHSDEIQQYFQSEALVKIVSNETRLDMLHRIFTVLVFINNIRK